MVSRFSFTLEEELSLVFKKLQTENAVQELRLVLLIGKGRYHLPSSPLGWQSPALTKIKTVWEWPLGRSLNGNRVIINHCLA